jgi:hypothetical protein
LEREKLNIHVVSNVTTQDVLAVTFSIQTLALFAKTPKPLLTMGNVQTSIQSTLYLKSDQSDANQAELLLILMQSPL